MDEGAAILFAVFAFGYLLITPIIALVRSRKAIREAELFAERISSLSSRLFEIERKLSALQKDIQAGTGVQVPSRPPESHAQPAPSPPLIVKEPVPVSPQPTPKTTPSTPTPGAPQSVGPTSPVETAQPLPVSVTTLSLPKFFAKAATEDGQPSEEEKWVNFEELLGANWLNKIGTAVFVIGVALFLSYSMRHLGPAGKISVGYAVAAALFGFGLWGDLHDRYRILSRAVLGGGWAITYFTTYAMSNVRAVRLIENPSLGFLLLFLVAAAMVIHSLRFRSEATTGFAYLLAFVSVAISRMSLGTLTASALLAASLAIVLWRRHWYTIEPLAIIATYGVHFLWLRQVFHALGGRKPFPEFGPSAALITLYWAVWMVSYFLREEEDPHGRNLLTASFLLNAAGYLILLHYQSFRPEWRFWFLLIAGAVYMGFAPLASRRARRRAFILTTTIGAAMIAAAFPYRYAGARVEIVWLLEAEILLIAGWRLAERHFRNLGYLAGAALTIYTLFHDLALRRVAWRPPDHPLGITLLTLAVAFYLQGKLFPRWLGGEATSIDTDSARASIVVATFFVLAAAWIALPFLYVGTAWAVIALVLVETGRRSLDADLQFSGHGAALLAAVRLLSNDLPWAQVYHLLGWLTVGLAACMFYLASRRMPRTTVALDEIPPAQDDMLRLPRVGIPATYTWTATLIGVLLIWRELSIGAIGLGWAMLGLALLEVGRALQDRPLTNQALGLLTLSFARIFFADLNVDDHLGYIPARVISVGALALIYYYSAVSSSQEESPHIISESRRRNLYFWFGWGALVALARFELQTAWVVVGWSAMTVVLFILGRATDLRALRYQAYTLAVLLGTRCAFDNFYQTSQGPFHIKVRTVTVVLASIALYILLAATIAAKRATTQAKPGAAGIPAPAESGND